MFAPQLLIYEKAPRWGPELKRQFLGTGVTCRVARTLPEIHRQIAGRPDCLLVMDLRAGAADCLRFVSQTNQTATPVRTLLIGSQQTRELQWVARELGADHFVEEDLGGSGLARLCRRYLNQQAADRSDNGRQPLFAAAVD